MDTATDLIKRLRAAGFTQSEISRRTGIPQPRLSRWEAGSPSVGANDALRLAGLAQNLSAEDRSKSGSNPLPQSEGGVTGHWSADMNAGRNLLCEGAHA
ncbi:helix-turn-helix domain-containing protein [Achromobacter xylosoxidans]|uniref:helix-turn-helix domain-containing protein n=1 Tax=Alcaligenes xylosoxydans xylosoxydans TaxID=85698 RepID=UPI003BAC99D6